VLKTLSLLSYAVTSVILSLITLAAVAADYPAPKEGDWVVRDFRFHTGEVLPELRLHYTTVGTSSGQPVLILHGTTGSGTGLLTPAFAGELFGPGQALDAGKYFIILPDAIGHGKSSKPSDGMRTTFPRYNYDDMVAAQYRLVTEGLGIRHVRLVLGNSMGGNWMMRRLIIDAIRNDPEWNNGNYTTQPRGVRVASVFYVIATSGGTLAYQKLAPTREKADKLLDDRLAAPFTADANDLLYQWDSSRDYNPSPGLEQIQAALLAVNSADDVRNPPETGIMDRELKRVKSGKLYLIPASDETRGHATTGMAKFWKQQVQELLETAPRRAM
jgi:homoserine O-acetyltransferase/O-succinyltransferase